MTDDQLYEHAASVAGAGVLGCKDMALSAMRKAISQAVEEERQRCCALVKYRWTFDGNQQHTHNWRAMADTIHDILSGNPAPKPPESRKRKDAS